MQGICARGQEYRCLGVLWHRLHIGDMIFNKFLHEEEDPFIYSLPYNGAIVQKAHKGIYSCIVLDFAVSINFSIIFKIFIILLNVMNLYYSKVPITSKFTNIFVETSCLWCPEHVPFVVSSLQHM